MKKFNAHSALAFICVSSIIMVVGLSVMALTKYLGTPLFGLCFLVLCLLVSVIAGYTITPKDKKDE